MTTATRDIFNQPMSHKYRGSNYAVLGLAVVLILAVTQLGVARVIEGPRDTATFSGFEMQNISTAHKF